MIKTDKKTSKYIIIFHLLLAVSIYQHQAIAQVPTDSLAILVNEGYAIMQSNPDRAEQLFEQALTISPNDLALRRQLGYLYSDNNKPERALKEFEKAEAIQSSDTIKLQMAFIQLTNGHEDKAVTILRELTESQDLFIKKSADEQLAAITSASVTVIPDEPSRWYSRIYAAPFYDTRWETIFYNFDAERGYYFNSKRTIFGYGFLSLAADGKSKLGEVPEIFSDNAIVGGVGIGVKPLTGLELRTQLGIAYDIIQQDSGVSRWSEDFRVLAIYGNGIYPDFEFHTDPKVTLEPLLDVYSSVGYYSRYKNVIGYLQGRAGVRIFEMSYTAADLYLRSMYVKDSEREFYNNQIDAAIGLRILPFYKWDLYVMAEYYRGTYLGNIARPSDFSKYFGGFRLFIIYDHIF
ncbi:MAG: tetratricopeptide repeat protein [Ignavibacteriales bacterium]|nr:tetratricopeptide repeat protein [Ignavibacteriales bacterium]